MQSTPEFTFLLSSERSGSNLITRCFDAHREFCAPPPSHVIRTMCDHLDRYGDLGEDRWWTQLVADVVAVLETTVAPWPTPWTAEDLCAAAEARSLGALVRAVYEAEASTAGKQRVFVKENHTWRYLPFLLSEFPGMKLVYLVRDPRDMASSWKGTPVLRGDVVRAASVWAEDQRHGVQALVQLRAMDRATLVRYEDLVDDPEHELQRLCSFLGSEFDPAMLRFHEASASEAQSGASSVWENVSRPMLQGNYGKYRTALSTDEVCHVESTCHGLMEVFGYEPDHPPSDSEEAARRVDRLRFAERHTKPEYADVPEEEKRRRAAWSALVAELDRRPVERLTRAGGPSD